MEKENNFKNQIIMDLLKFFVAIFFAISLVVIFLKFYIQPKIDKDMIECRLQNSFPLIICVLVSSGLITTWFCLKGKSVKALNDFLLFLSAAIAAYYYLFDYEKYEIYRNHSILCKNLGYLCWQTLLINCSFAKAFIAAAEFYQERSILIKKSLEKNDNQETNKTHTDKELFFYNIIGSIIDSVKNRRN